jgi:hypothetical protein
MEHQNKRNNNGSKKYSQTQQSIDEKKQRGQIKNLSYGSTKRARHILRNLPNEMTHEIGLTYPRQFPKDGAVVKTHLHKMMLRFNYRGIRTFWFMEFQKRGACHFHLIVDKEIDEDELKRIWYEIVGSGDMRHREHGAHISPIRNTDSFKKYLSSYLTKEEQKKVPYFYHNAGRFWGYSRSLVNVNIAIIVGPKDEIRRIRKNYRIFRRWQKARFRQWNGKAVTTKKMKNINPYVYVLPGEYLFFADARKLIDAVKGTPYDDELFEDWSRAWA